MNRKHGRWQAMLRIVGPRLPEKRNAVMVLQDVLGRPIGKSEYGVCHPEIPLKPVTRLSTSTSNIQRGRALSEDLSFNRLA